MKTSLYSTLLVFTFLLLSAPFSVQAEEGRAETLALPVLKQGEALPKSRWEVDRLFVQLLEQLPSFVSKLPQNVKRVTLLNLDGDQTYDLTPNRLSYQLLNALVSEGRLEMVECRQCSNLKIYVEDDTLVLAKSLDTNEQYQALGKKLNIDAYLQGFLEIDEESGKLSLNLKLVRTSDGSVVRTASLSAQGKEEDKGLANPEHRESHYGLAVSPFIGFKYKGWIQTATGQTEKQITNFTALSLRLLTPTFWETIDLGLDIDSFTASTTTGTEALKLPVTQVVPLIRYRLPLNLGGQDLFSVYLGFGGAVVNGETGLGIKAGGEFFINHRLSIGLDVYQIGNREVTSTFKDSNGNFLNNQFSGNAIGASFRYLY